MSNDSEIRKKALGIVVILVILGLSILMGIRRQPGTGTLSIDFGILLWGILGSVMVYIAVTLRNFVFRFPLRIRFCVSCGRNIPFDSVICPYCRFDYEKGPG